VLAFLALRFRLVICRIGSAIALALATGGLLHRLPLHRKPYDLVLNLPFASWAFVIVCAAVVTYLVHRYRKDALKLDAYWAGGAALVAFVLGCTLVSMEVVQIWSVAPSAERVAHYRTHALSSLVVVWALIPLLASLALYLRKFPRWTPLALASYGVGVLVLLASLVHYEVKSEWLCLNATFLPKLLFAASLWYGGAILRRMDCRVEGNVATVVGHAVLALLLAFEMDRWADWSELVSDKIGLSLISAAWGVQAFTLVVLGLMTKNKARRMVGFALFALTLGKVWLVDLSEVAQVYRIISFMATGFLLLGAAYCYHRFNDMLTEEHNQGESS
jgi:uncharacterized membrane protein